jgi:hypothetical protein
MGGSGCRAHARCMTTLHIDITVNDLSTFRSGYAEHEDIRRQAGVEAERISQVAGQDGRLQIELDFPSADRAEAFVGFLRESVWKDNPVLVGTPQPTILEPLAFATA